MANATGNAAFESPRNGERSPLNANANPYYGRGYVQHAGIVPNIANLRVMADAPSGSGNAASDQQELMGSGSPLMPVRERRRSVHECLGPPLADLGFVPPAASNPNAVGISAGFANPKMAPPRSDLGYNGAPPVAAVPPYGAGPASGGPPDLADLAPPPQFADMAFANDVLNPPAPGVDPTAQAITNLTNTMNFCVIATMGVRQELRAENRQLQNRVDELQASLTNVGIGAPPQTVAPVDSVPPVRPVAQYAAAAVSAAHAFAPYMAPPGALVPPYAHVSLAPPSQVGGGPLPGAPPQYMFQPGAFAPPSAYYNPFTPDGGPAPPAGGPFPRTGFHPGPARPTGPGACRPSMFSLPSSLAPDEFAPVQPAKPLLIDDFLSVNALNALKMAPNKLLVDPFGGSILLQPASDMSGTMSTKKAKCPDLPAWLKASERIKTALVSMGAIRGPDYDRYSDSCLTLLLDPKCGGNGWAFDIFFEFDNAHRIQQWSTGAAFEHICPMRMAHFAAMAAQPKLKTSSPFLDSAGSGQKRSREGTNRAQGPVLHLP
jgi:hypothetical protein